jgi:hypothetical protein
MWKIRRISLYPNIFPFIACAFNVRASESEQRQHSPSLSKSNFL